LWGALAGYCLDRAEVLARFGDHAQAFQAIEDLPLSANTFAPERSPTEVGDKARHAWWFYKVQQQLHDCVTLAEHDIAISPTERAQAVRTYSERAGSFQREAQRAAEDWARHYMKNEEGRTGNFVLQIGESLIARNRRMWGDQRFSDLQ